jgi:hypothetical protein
MIARAAAPSDDRAAPAGERHGAQRPTRVLRRPALPAARLISNAEAWGFEQLSDETIHFIDEIERVTGARVSLISTGFMPHRGIIDRRQR